MWIDPEGPEHAFFFTDISSLPPLLIHNSKAIRFNKWGKSRFKRMTVTSIDLPLIPSPKEACNCPLRRHRRQLSSCYAMSCCNVSSSSFVVLTNQKANAFCLIRAMSNSGWWPFGKSLIHRALFVFSRAGMASEIRGEEPRFYFQKSSSPSYIYRDN